MPPRKSKNANFGGCFLVIFFSIFFAVGIGVVWAMAIGPALKVSFSQTWTQTPCVIRQIEIKVHSGDDDTYSPEVVFDYTVDGHRYTSEKFWFGIGSTGSRRPIELAIAPFEVGGEYVCFVNPKNPNDAVLLRQPAPFTWIAALVGGIFGLVGAVGMYAGIATRSGKKRKSTTHETPSRQILSTRSSNRSSTKSDTFDGRTDSQPQYDFDSSTCPVEDEGPDEPLPLSAKGSRVGTAIGSWFFAIIWNGITWIVGYFVLKDFNLFPALFLAVFFLIGIAVLLFAIYSTLQIWNPRTIVVCSQRNLYPGSEFEISWLHQGNAASISELSILLEGSESATYRQGTTTRTDKSIFFKQTIVQTKERSEIDSGFSLARLPEDTMHSFESGRNSISWQIQVHGKIRFWPDINDTFAITIYPPKGDGVNHA